MEQYERAEPGQWSSGLASAKGTADDTLKEVLRQSGNKGNVLRNALHHLTSSPGRLAALGGGAAALP